MATEFKLPELGENIEAADVVNVLVKEGDILRERHCEEFDDEAIYITQQIASLEDSFAMTL